MAAPVYSLATEPMTDIKMLLATLRMYGVNIVLDVRSRYEVQKTPGLSKQEVFELCPLWGIDYVDAADGFSMDVEEKKYLHSKGYVNYEKYTSSLAFHMQMDRVRAYAAEGRAVCLLGYREKVPTCHRFIIASELLKQGFDVLHIGPGPLKPHSELEREEVETSFPELDQIAMFEVPKEPYESKLTKTLKLVNMSVGEAWLKEAPLK